MNQSKIKNAVRLTFNDNKLILTLKVLLLWLIEVISADLNLTSSAQFKRFKSHHTLKATTTSSSTLMKYEF